MLLFPTFLVTLRAVPLPQIGYPAYIAAPHCFKETEREISSVDPLDRFDPATGENLRYLLLRTSPRGSAHLPDRLGVDP
jgi:hypothetical protein